MTAFISAGPGFFGRGSANPWAESAMRLASSLEMVSTRAILDSGQRDLAYLLDVDSTYCCGTLLIRRLLTGELFEFAQVAKLSA